MHSNILDKEGKILKKFQPALYLDSSVLIDYWSVEGLSLPDDELLNEISDLNSDELMEWLENQLKLGNEYEVQTVMESVNDPTSLLIRDLFKTDKKFQKMIKLGRKFVMKILISYLFSVH